MIYDDVLCDIETKAFTFGLDIEDEEIGILDKILAPAESTVQENEPICVLLHAEKKKKRDDGSNESSS